MADKLDAKTAYSEAGNLLRFYLGWRQAMLAGYVAATYFVVTKSFELFADDHSVQVAILLAGLAILGKYLADADLRNRELYHAATKSAECIEKDKPPSLYQAINEVPAPADPATYGPHTKLLQCIYLGGASIFALAALAMLFYACRPPHQ